MIGEAIYIRVLDRK